MDAQERKDDLIEAHKLLERAKELFFGCGEKTLAWEVNDMLNEIDEAIDDADSDCIAEQREESDALTRQYFMDAVGL